MHRKQLLELAQGFKAPYPKTASVVDVFERVVKKYPGRIALQFLEKTLTYRELNLRANKIARHLRKIGVKNNDLVGIGLEKSVDLFVGIVAILKAGAAYVPIDASYPMERKLYMIKDAKLRVFLTSSTLEKEFPAKKLTFVRLDEVDFSSYLSTDLGLSITHQELRENPKECSYSIGELTAISQRPIGSIFCQRIAFCKFAISRLTG
jgi:non-ribosomal peptide synthetase component F